MRKSLILLSFLLLSCSTNSQNEKRAISNAPLTSDSWIEKLKEAAQTSVETGYNPGIALGIIDESGKQEIYTYGVMDLEKKTPISKDTLFEIGSITKVVTAELLAKYVIEGKVSLDDEIKKFMPSLANADAGKVTLKELSTHSSGLPRLPNNMNPKDQKNPYADYTRAQLMTFLESYKETKTKPYPSKYSNLGFAILGTILADLDSKNYESIIKKEVLIPLNTPMTITLSKKQKKNFATPYYLGIEKTSPWDVGFFNGTGGLRGTIQDLLSFAHSQLKPEATSLKEATLLAQETHYKDESTRMGLGWYIRETEEGVVYSKDGGTGGFVSLIMTQPKTGRAFAILTNSTNDIPCMGSYFRKEECKEKPAYAISVEEMQRILGTYESEKGQKIEYVLSPNKKFLIAQIVNQQPWLLRAQSPTAFSFIGIEVEVIFSEVEGPLQEFTLKQGGKDYHYKRVK